MALKRTDLTYFLLIQSAKPFVSIRDAKLLLEHSNNGKRICDECNIILRMTASTFFNS